MTAPEFPIRLIALDIDGTLVDDELVIGPRTIAAVRVRRTTVAASVTGVRSSKGECAPWWSIIASSLSREG